MLATVLGTREFVPAGPLAQEKGFGPGADWDVQWAMGGMARASRAEGLVPHWDPFSQYGVPLLANPEAFVAHPAWQLFVALGVRPALKAMAVVQCLAFFLGLWWLGARLKLPWYLSIASGLAFVCSPEWTDRLNAGHLMFLGVCAWPACLAGVLSALDREGRSWTQLAFGAVAGGALALANLGGGHYPTALGLTAAVALTWAVGAGGRPMLALLGLLTLPLWLLGVPTEGRYVIVAAGFAVIGWGLWRSERRWAQLRCLSGVALGVLAVGGFRIVPEGAMMVMSARGVAPDLGIPDVEPFALAMPWTEPWHGSESCLYYGWPGWLAILLLGLVMLARVHAPLAFLGGSFLLLAWASGRPLQPWELVSFLPGMSAVNYPMRLQWMLPLVAPLGVAGFLYLEASRRRGTVAAAAVAATLIAVAAAGTWRHLDRRYPMYPADPENSASFAAATDVVGVAGTPAEVHLSLAAADGLIHPYYGAALAYGDLQIPQRAGGELAWPGADCAAPPGTPTVEVEGSLISWEIEAPPGTVVTLAQRDLPGWTCEGGDIVEGWCDDSPEGHQPHGKGNRWLRVQVADTGHASCRWRTPGLRTGIGLQILALAVLAGIVLRARRAKSRR